MWAFALSLSLFKNYIYLFTCMCVCTCYGTRVRSEDNFGNQFSPSTLWASGIELRSSGLAASALTHWATSQAPLFKRDVLDLPGGLAVGHHLWSSTRAATRQRTRPFPVQQGKKSACLYFIYYLFWDKVLLWLAWNSEIHPPLLSPRIKGVAAEP